MLGSVGFQPTEKCHLSKRHQIQRLEASVTKLQQTVSSVLADPWPVEQSGFHRVRPNIFQMTTERRFGPNEVIERFFHPHWSELANNPIDLVCGEGFDGVQNHAKLETCLRLNYQVNMVGHDAPSEEVTSFVIKVEN
jgi:hypothetical protein